MIPQKDGESSPAYSEMIFLHWMPVILYCILIFIQSAFPSPVNLADSLPQGDKFLHFGGYVLLGWLFSRAFYRSFPQKHVFLLFCLSFLSSASYGGLDEIHQSFISSRTADIMDFLADMAGSAAGSLCYFIFAVGKNIRKIKIAD